MVLPLVEGETGIATKRPGSHWLPGLFLCGTNAHQQGADQVVAMRQVVELLIEHTRLHNY
jgi:hypothetical protein